MQKIKSSSKKSNWLLLPLAIAAFSLLMITSCCRKKSTFPTCVKLTKAQIQKWVKEGYTDPANKNYMLSVRFKTAYASPGGVFRVFVTGLRKDGSLINESLTELTPVDTCNKEHIKLSDFIFTGTNPANLSDLGIVQSNGKIIDSLQFLQLAPFNYTDPVTKYDFLAYDIFTVKKGGVISNSLVPRVGLPCPPCPNCNASSCPPPCTSCGSIADSTANNPQ